MSVSVTSGRIPLLEEALSLYESVGWTAYTRDPQLIQAALEGSTAVFCARDEAGALVGLARILSDGAAVTLVQDILVAPGQHRSGVGSLLMDAVHEASQGIRQLVLFTDAEPGHRAFYEANGLTEVHDLSSPGRAFVRYL
ncbi:GNAT family N-acetyltransferase [Galactobacter caseinivorans]|uniref:N-acetyltransferase n=1 Tax=Galactobacter caseinivorans TaxID=2676123 RepID=A0A496PIW7_9MICC|nr:GNAT family N-acetyltransferase [Galactobacter caseinivorans]RKW70445.1 N-acetyltransferase [Galactobacter caseinivorans]